MSSTSFATYFRRGCLECGGCGFVPVCGTPESRPVRQACAPCAGRGSVNVYLYRRPSNWRGEWPPREVLASASPFQRPTTKAPQLQSVQLSLWPGAA